MLILDPYLRSRTADLSLFIVGEHEPIRVHKIVLAGRSRYFRSLLLTKRRKKNKKSPDSEQPSEAKNPFSDDDIEDDFVVVKSSSSNSGEESQLNGINDGEHDAASSAEDNPFSDDENAGIIPNPFDEPTELSADEDRLVAQTEAEREPVETAPKKETADQLNGAEGETAEPKTVDEVQANPFSDDESSQSPGFIPEESKENPFSSDDETEPVTETTQIEPAKDNPFSDEEDEGLEEHSTEKIAPIDDNVANPFSDDEVATDELHKDHEPSVTPNPFSDDDESTVADELAGAKEAEKLEPSEDAKANPFGSSDDEGAVSETQDDTLGALLSPTRTKVNPFSSDDEREEPAGKNLASSLFSDEEPQKLNVTHEEDTDLFSDPLLDPPRAKAKKSIEDTLFSDQSDSDVDSDYDDPLQLQTADKNEEKTSVAEDDPFADVLEEAPQSTKKAIAQETLEALVFGDDDEEYEEADILDETAPETEANAESETKDEDFEVLDATEPKTPEPVAKPSKDLGADGISVSGESDEEYQDEIQYTPMLTKLIKSDYKNIIEQDKKDTEEADKEHLKDVKELVDVKRNISKELQGMHNDKGSFNPFDDEAKVEKKSDEIVDIFGEGGDLVDRKWEEEHAHDVILDPFFEEEASTPTTKETKKEEDDIEAIFQMDGSAVKEIKASIPIEARNVTDLLEETKAFKAPPPVVPTIRDHAKDVAEAGVFSMEDMSASAKAPFDEDENSDTIVGTPVDDIFGGNTGASADVDADIDAIFGDEAPLPSPVGSYQSKRLAEREKAASSKQNLRPSLIPKDDPTDLSSMESVSDDRISNSVHSSGTSPVRIANDTELNSPPRGSPRSPPRIEYTPKSKIARTEDALEEPILDEAVEANGLREIHFGRHVQMSGDSPYVDREDYFVSSQDEQVIYHVQDPQKLRTIPFKRHVLDFVIAFIYTGKLQCGRDEKTYTEWIEIFDLAHLFSLDELLYQLCQFVTEPLTHDNVFENLGFAYKYDIEDMKRDCLLFIEQNPKVLNQLRERTLSNKILVELCKHLGSAILNLRS